MNSKPTIREELQLEIIFCGELDDGAYSIAFAEFKAREGFSFQIQTDGDAGHQTVALKLDSYCLMDALAIEELSALR